MCFLGSIPYSCSSVFVVITYSPSGLIPDCMEGVFFILLLLPNPASWSVLHWGSYPSLTNKQRLTKEVDHKAIVVAINVCGRIGLKLDGDISHGRVKFKA